MIPLHLTISGFLSYRDLIELDFTGFELACIAGSNGAGKSSLLDAITWVLFGQARKKDDSLINAQSDAAEVSLVFTYEGNIYRVARSKPRDKTALLEFNILRNGDRWPVENEQALWKPLTERTLRETEARIQNTLRLDYETFVNAAFFLQGKADQYTQQRPGDRKRILGSILGLEIWEVYRQRAAERRKTSEAEIASLDGRLHEIANELDEEKERKSRLKELEQGLERLNKERLVQESGLQAIREIAAALAEQHKLVNSLARQLDASEKRLQEQEKRAEARLLERHQQAEIIAQAEKIQAAYLSWQASRTELENWEAVAARFRKHEKRREGPRDEINAARARLEQERDSLQAEMARIETARPQIEQLAVQIEAAQEKLAEVENDLARRAELDAELQTALERQAMAQAENPRLRTEMDDLKDRIDQLTEVEGAVCPLCGQPLSPEDRHNLVQSLQDQGKDMGDRYRANQTLLRESDGQVKALKQDISNLSRAEKGRLALTRELADLASRLAQGQKQVEVWDQTGRKRLLEAEQSLSQQEYAPDAQMRLAEIDAELKEIGYDAAAHDATRKQELSGRASEAEVRALEKAQAALAPLEREIADLTTQINAQSEEIQKQRAEYEGAAAGLAAAEAQAPDLLAAERALRDLQEQENRLRLEVGAAHQKVLVLGDLKKRRKLLNAEREERASRVGQYRQLERAFGKDGVPALLIEQALPEIETRANEILDRLSAGNMTVRFVTQAAYKDKRRDDLKETLDIQISDSVGIRDYEMFSGGEAFRVNFAIRLALSEVLAQRAGARLQTLVIDEGFGSQDAQGRQRLIEAINLVQPDFAKILVITHIEELKDIFPTRIEVEKTERGSTVRIV
jgi:exonuclease SbcC